MRYQMIEMKILSGRDEWLKHRMNYIGGSESSAVIGCNPYMSNVELFMLKTGQAAAEDISDKPYVQYGIAAEPLIRELFKLNYPGMKSAMRKTTVSPMTGCHGRQHRLTAGLLKRTQAGTEYLR